MSVDTIAVHARLAHEPYQPEAQVRRRPPKSSLALRVNMLAVAVALCATDEAILSTFSVAAETHRNDVLVYGAKNAYYPRNTFCSVTECRMTTRPRRAFIAKDGLTAQTGRAPASSPMSERPGPMLCTLVDAAFDDPDWTFEPKFDGLRIIAHFDGHEVTLLSRNEKSQGLRFPEIVAGLRESLQHPSIVDGEIVCLDGQGRASFRSVQQRFHVDDPGEIRRSMEQYPAYIYLFDILDLDGQDVSKLPLSRRRELLEGEVAWSDRVRLTESQVARGIDRWRRACERGEEGIVAKRLDSVYVSGRSDAWVKVKCVDRQELAIGGWTDPQRSRVGLGALLVGYYDGADLRYAGKVGTGYTREVLLDLRRRLDALRQENNPFVAGDPPTGEAVHWVRPELVAEIGFAEWTQNGLLRQPRYEGLRPDKAARECRRERAANTSAVLSQETAAARPPKRKGETAMPLEDYRAKRDFRKTREPSGTEGARPRERPIFEVQEHHASHLHYDFRLEADGVLKSWSVPKGPSLDPAVKRLAVQVADHPLGYASFEGTIPQGQYGGGTVKIWDRGTYESLMETKAEPRTVAEAIDAGHLEFVLYGEKLKGRFALIRMRARGAGKPQWLLIKMKDEFAETVRAEPEAKPRTARAGLSRANRTGTVRVKGSVKKPANVELTHPDRIIFPELGITKEAVFTYYRKVANRLLPFLKDRLVTLERLPEGLAEGAPHSWQKNTPDCYPEWIPRIELKTERGKAVHYVLVNDDATLLYLVNQGTLTFHVWASGVSDLDRPDFVLFDLDPGRASFQDAVAVARSVHTTLEEYGAKAFVKTSGKSGLHVLTPWNSRRGLRRGQGLGVGGRGPRNGRNERPGDLGRPQGESGRARLYRCLAERPGPLRCAAICGACRPQRDRFHAARLARALPESRPRHIHDEKHHRPVETAKARPAGWTSQTVRCTPRQE